jgi:signal transduction histidine kinase
VLLGIKRLSHTLPFWNVCDSFCIAIKLYVVIQHQYQYFYTFEKEASMPTQALSPSVVQPTAAPMMKLYAAISALPRPKSYIGKFLTVAFLGVHVPLIALVLYVAVGKGTWTDALALLVVALVATLAGTGVTLFVQGRLLAPITQTSRALKQYVETRSLPALPTTFSDDAGRLMANAQQCVTTLDDLLQMKNNLLAVLSHDVRTPLTSIILGIDLLKSHLEDPIKNKEHMERMLGRIMASAYYQLDLMNNILSLARSNSGMMEVQPTPTTLQDIMETASNNATLQAEAKGIRFEAVNEAPASTALQVDIEKTTQIINNLLHNALKFTPSSGSVKLTARATDNEVEFSVEDSGIGMSEDIVEQIFQRFSAGQRKGTASETGTGLGLWICKTFTEIQGGHIAVYSKAGEGTRFTVRLPKVVQQRAIRAMVA